MSTLAEEVHHQLLSKGLTLSIAESCTGGALAAMFTSFPGASAYFVGGAVAYSNFAKQELAGVDPHVIEFYGAVSAETARAMAEGIRQKLRSDISVAVTGIAGPGGGVPGKPVGTVWCALSCTTTIVWQLQLEGSRNEIIQQTCEAVCAQLAAWIAKTA